MREYDERKTVEQTQAESQGDHAAVNPGKVLMDFTERVAYVLGKDETLNMPKDWLFGRLVRNEGCNPPVYGVHPSFAKAYEELGHAQREAFRKDHCPKCDGELDTGWECNKCGFDAMEAGWAPARITGAEELDVHYPMRELDRWHDDGGTISAGVDYGKEEPVVMFMGSEPTPLLPPLAPPLAALADEIISTDDMAALAGHISYEAKQSALAKLEHQARVDEAANTRLGRAYLALRHATTGKQIRSARSRIRRETRNAMVKTMRANNETFRRHPHVAKAIAADIVRKSMSTHG